MTTVKNQICDHDRRLDSCLRRQVGITVDTYKAARFVFRAVAIGTIVATAILPEASLPPSGYLVLGGVALGPDVVEAYLTRNE